MSTGVPSACVGGICGNVCRMAGQIEEGDLVRLRSKWQETMGKIHGASPTPAPVVPE